MSMVRLVGELKLVDNNGNISDVTPIDLSVKKRKSQDKFNVLTSDGEKISVTLEKIYDLYPFEYNTRLKM